MLITCKIVIEDNKGENPDGLGYGSELSNTAPKSQ